MVWKVLKIALEVIGACGVLLFVFGYRPIADKGTPLDWNAVSAIGTCFIPIAVVFLQFLIDQNKKDISGANADLLKEIEETKREFQEKLLLVTTKVQQNNQTAVPTKEQLREQRKKEALKLINISMMADTQAVADKIGCSKEDTFDLLREMLLNDRTISCAGQCNINNIDGIVWTRRRE